jgi:hypothetical protein
MADFNKPTQNDEYTSVLDDIRSNVSISATMNYAGASNIPLNSVQFISGAFQTYNGAEFVNQPVSITGGGTGASNSSAARGNLNVYSKSEVDLKDSSLQTNIDLHIANANAHTKNQVGLSNIPNSISNSYTLNSSSTLATSKAVNDLKINIDSSYYDITEIQANYYTKSESNSRYSYEPPITSRVSSAGSFVKSPDGQSPSSWGVSRLSTGQYRITNVQINTSYTVLINVDTGPLGYGLSANVFRENDRFTVYISDENRTLTNSDFSFILIKD